MERVGSSSLLAPADIPAGWRELLRLVPGYDSLATAEDSLFSTEAADLALAFFPECLKHVEGDVAGQPFVLERWQQAVIANLFGWMREDARGRWVRRYREAFLYIPRKNGKALDVDTPIPTPDGWKSMGDLVAGDKVFDEAGGVCNVVEAHPVMTGHECFSVRFSDGTAVVADADHLWTLHDRYKDGRAVTLTTREVAATYIVGNRETHVERRYNLPATSHLSLPAKQLPIEPYTLGVWLGDGDSDCARITNSSDDEELLNNVRAAGTTAVVQRYDQRSKARRVILGSNGRGKPGSLQSKLRAAGLLGNKHVPAEYLRASESQRMSLLQGLMDTDGYVSKAGQCEFVSISDRLFGDVLELLRTLGYKATSSVDRARINGKDCGLRYRIQFWAYKERPALRLTRKVVRLKSVPIGRPRSATKQVISVEPTASVPVRCIRVDSPSRLFLAGPGMVPTHNTPLAAGICLYGLFCDGEAGAQVYSAAAEREQAALLYRHAKGMVEQDRELSNRARIYGGLGQRSIVLKNDAASSYKVLSADAQTKHGFNSHLVVVDELHAHPSRDLVDVLKTSMASAGRKQPLMVYITTADYFRPSICNETHDYACKVRDGVIGDVRFLPVIYESLPEEDWTDPRVWEKANPNLGVSVSRDYLTAECKKAKEVPAYENTFKRLHLNMKTETDIRWLAMDRWDACNGAVDEAALEGRECCSGLDLSNKVDLTAHALAFWPTDDDPLWRILVRFWLPREKAEQRERQDRVPYLTWVRKGLITLTEGNVVDYDFIKASVLEDAKKFRIRQIAYDPWNATQIALQLQTDGAPMLEFRQGFPSMSEPCKELERLIVAKKLAHGGNAVLRWNAANVCVKLDPAGNLKPDKSKSTEKIDGIVALVMAIGATLRYLDQSLGKFYEENELEIA